MAGRLVLLLGLVAGCHERGPDATGPVVLLPTSSSAVVATVNGAPILASAVEAQMRSGQDRAQAVRRLVQEELLVQEAARRGLDRHASVKDVQRRAMVELLVRRRFRDELGPAQIPRRLVEMSYKKNLARFRHPELVDVSHFLAEARRKDPPAVHEAARRLAERARSQLTASPLTPDGFVALGKKIVAEAAPAKTRVETLTTPQRGYTVRAFADAAFALGQPGAVSPVVPTRYGYHVIYLRKRIPAVDIPLEQAEAEIRVRILDEARAELLMEHIDSLEKKLGVRLLTENLPGEATR